ncbi:MAG TPA: D-glycero-beta-D-manno-heptose 1-phosphate adenylyltransferase [Chthoniobacterales bacterium]|jgi:rfaE bifunctional protein nucleotidyltransferase chain/domain|nr:D-glycero-beta-D-manno-heptose 1-phosphate adenylyltransferase [Chthoniobacterales bacterium]
MNKKIVTPDQARAIAKEMKDRGRKLVFTNGCFDLLHVGHVHYLAAARALGDALLVAVNGDESVRALKGDGRPLNREADRAEVIAALESVDHVVIFPEVRVTALLEKIQPAIYVKGGDYTAESLHAEERSALERMGTEILIVPFETGYSTSQLLKRMTKVPAE